VYPAWKKHFARVQHIQKTHKTVFILLPRQRERALILAKCLHNKMAKNILTTKLGVSLGTLKNWEFGRTHPNRKSWSTIDHLY
jgi:membrane protein YqaA with SNARE-associated domain